MRGSGCEVWRGESLLDGKPIVLIATSLKKNPLPNDKTGDVINTWILRQDLSPFDALKTREDVSICGACPHRPQGEGLSLRSCYVHPGKVNNIWVCWTKGRYHMFDEVPEKTREIMSTRLLRMGSYGDPAAVPQWVWEGLLDAVAGAISYTHSPKVQPELKRWSMASADSEAHALALQAAGWRTYRTRLPDEPLMPGEIECPAEAAKGQPRKTTCTACRLCDGISYEIDKRKNISAVVHGFPPNVYAYKEFAKTGRASLPILDVA